MASESLRDVRSEILESEGARGPVIEELLAYNENRFDATRYAGLRLPLSDEPQLEAWSEYKQEADAMGVIPALARRFVQLSFPVELGISQQDHYRAATRRGVFPEGGAGPRLNRPEGVELVLHPTVAGRIPLLVVADRADFVALVRVFSGRNEPIAVPDSMGACIVTGLNNWDRVGRYRRRFEAERGAADEDVWLAEFKQRLVPRKELYQDRFIILSRGAYSAVPALDVGLPDDEWLALSLRIRREHECTHYFTCRVFGSMRNNLLDEIIGDFAGLMATFGRYDGGLALRFFGLEDYPRFRQGGRLQSYLGEPPLSQDAVVVLRTLVFRAVRNIEAFATIHEALRAPDATGRMVVALTGMTLEQLASPEMAACLSDALESDADRLELALPGTHEGIATLLKELQAFSSRHTELASSYSDLCVVLDEVVSNIVKYGYGENVEGAVYVSLALREGVLEVEVVDDAPAFNPLERPAPRTDQALQDRPVGGLGIHIVKRLMGEVGYTREGGKNRLLLRKRLA